MFWFHAKIRLWRNECFRIKWILNIHFLADNVFRNGTIFVLFRFSRLLHDSMTAELFLLTKYFSILFCSSVQSLVLRLVSEPVSMDKHFVTRVFTAAARRAAVVIMSRSLSLTVCVTSLQSLASDWLKISSSLRSRSMSFTKTKYCRDHPRNWQYLL